MLRNRRTAAREERVVIAIILKQTPGPGVPEAYVETLNAHAELIRAYGINPFINGSLQWNTTIIWANGAS